MPWRHHGFVNGLNKYKTEQTPKKRPKNPSPLAHAVMMTDKWWHILARSSPASDCPIKAADFKANFVLAGPRRQRFPAAPLQVFSNDGQDGGKITEGTFSATKTASPSTCLPPPPPSSPSSISLLCQLLPLPPLYRLDFNH